MENNFILKSVKDFDLAITLDCGQAFRWKEHPKGGFEGIVGDRYLHIEQKSNDIIFHNICEKEYKTFWHNYFDFDRDYGEIIKKACLDERLVPITKDCGGIRLLRQQPWETLCSFIISQNNNIPRIKGIIERLCTGFGEKIEGGYTFPSAEKLAGLEVENLAELRSGFRAKYIIDAARKCANGEVDLEKIKEFSLDDAREMLMRIKGVGPKVADCTLLFGLGFIEAFPMDVWMKRAMEKLFKDGLPENLKDCGGIIQQYIFHYARTTNLQV